MKIATSAALIYASLFFLPAQGQAEEHYSYKDAIAVVERSTSSITKPEELGKESATI